MLADYVMSLQCDFNGLTSTDRNEQNLELEVLKLWKKINDCWVIRYRENFRA